MVSPLPSFDMCFSLHFSFLLCPYYAFPFTLRGFLITVISFVLIMLSSHFLFTFFIMLILLLCFLLFICVAFFSQHIAMYIFPSYATFFNYQQNNKAFKSYTHITKSSQSGSWLEVAHYFFVGNLFKEGLECCCI